jgi:hypothetical protein
MPRTHSDMLRLPSIHTFLLTETVSTARNILRSLSLGRVVNFQPSAIVDSCSRGPQNAQARMSFIANSKQAGTPKQSYRHDPYAKEGKHYYHDDVASLADSVTSIAPHGTRHPSLWGLVSFVPYPVEEFVAPPAELPADKEVVRVFVGQLPYFVTDMQLAWLCHTFGGGNLVAFPERIMKRQPNGERLPTGCIHAFATEEAVAAMATACTSVCLWTTRACGTRRPARSLRSSRTTSRP